MLKRLTFSHEKCIILVVNRKQSDALPKLCINNQLLKVENKAKLLGDILNSKWDFNDLISDRMVKAYIIGQRPEYKSSFEISDIREPGIEL